MHIHVHIYAYANIYVCMYPAYICLIRNKMPESSIFQYLTLHAVCGREYPALEAEI